MDVKETRKLPGLVIYSLKKTLHLQQLKGLESSKQGMYVKGVTFVNRKYTKGVPFLSTIARILQPYNIRVAPKPITTLRRLLTNVKGKDKPGYRH